MSTKFRVLHLDDVGDNLTSDISSKVFTKREGWDPEFFTKVETLA
jgi:hypothetical protein